MQKVKSLWGKVVGFLEGGTEEDDWGDSRGFTEYYPQSTYQEPSFADTSFDEYDDEGLDFAGLERRDRNRNSSKKVNNVFELDAARKKDDQMIIRICRPKEMQDATLICEYLQNNLICIVDMQGVDHVTAQRIADYLGGVGYALRGHVERIDNYIFVMAPDEVKIDFDLKEDIKSGLFKSFK